MTFKRNALALSLTLAAVFATAGGVQAATCDISMPASGSSAAVAATNANIAAVLQAQYPGVQFTPASATQSSSASVPNCNGADFANTGANISTVRPNAPATELGAREAGIAGAIILICALACGNGSGTTTTTTGS